MDLLTLDSLDESQVWCSHDLVSSLLLLLSFFDASNSAILIATLPRCALNATIKLYTSLALILSSQARRHPRREVEYQEGQQESHSRRQREESMRDYHAARGANGLETSKQSSVSAHHRAQRQ